MKINIYPLYTYIRHPTDSEQKEKIRLHEFYSNIYKTFKYATNTLDSMRNMACHIIRHQIIAKMLNNKY